MRVLALDIETAPAIVATFSLFKPIIGHGQIIEPGRILCFSAQWEDEKVTRFHSERDGYGVMLDHLHTLLDQADVVVTYNGKKFDIPWITGELIIAGYTPPSPYKQVDLYQVIRSNARLLSNKLDYVAKRLLDERKVSHQGFQLWLDCMAGDDKAWKTMEKYAKKDTALLIPLYRKLRPWIKVGPNAALYNGTNGCPRCGHEKLLKRGFQPTANCFYQRFQCKSCGAWSRGSTPVARTASRNAL